MTISARKRRKKLRRLFAWLGFAMAALLVVLLGAFVITGCAAVGGKPDGERLARAQ